MLRWQGWQSIVVIFVKIDSIQSRLIGICSTLCQRKKMDLATLKIILIVVLLLLPLGFTLLPFKLIKYVEGADESRKER